MRKSNADTAKEIGSVIAYRMFLTMLNPKYRGKKFNWDRFVDLAERHAEVSCYMYFPLQVFEKHETKLKKIAVESASRTAKDCLEESGILEWFYEKESK